MTGLTSPQILTQSSDGVGIPPQGRQIHVKMIYFGKSLRSVYKNYINM